MKKIKIIILITILNISFSPFSNAFATKHIISVQNYSFSPASITNVTVGDTMRWVWVSGSHTTTSTTIPSGAGTWNSNINSTTTSFEYKVTVAGSYNYKCTPHAAMGMVGTFDATAQTATLAISPHNQNVTSGAGSTSFNVTSNSFWSAQSNSAWCSCTASGNGNGTILSTFEANTSVNQRVATITVTVDGLPAQQITVTQAGASATLQVDPINQNVSYHAGATTFSITTNTNWSANCGSNWCSVTPSGNGNGILTATYTENMTNAMRIATILINVAGLTPYQVTVTQDLSSVSIEESPIGSFSLYPNPTNGAFTVSTDEGLNKPVFITVTNSIGIRVYSLKAESSKSYSLDLSRLPKGLYFVRLISDSGIRTSKIELVGE